MTITADRRLQDFANADTLQWTNDTGAATVNNQLVFIAAGTNKGLVGLSVGAIANGAVGTIIIKGRVKLPAAAVVMLQGYPAQAATSSASCTVSGTASGLYAVGMVCDTIATSAGYVNVDLNSGPSAFYVW